MRPDLIDRARAALAEAGFQLSEAGPVRPITFDLVARRATTVVLVKVFTNADSLGEPLAHELRTLAGLLGAAPLLVGERSSAGPLEDGVLYFRHRIPLITPGTLEGSLLHGEPPLVYAAPGGYYVNLDGPALRELREARHLSLGQLAEAAGVSRRAIAMYEEGMGALVDVAERLEAFLQEPLVRPVDMLQAPPAEKAASPFDPEGLHEALGRRILGSLHEMGFTITLTHRSLFDAVTTREEKATLILTGVGEMEPDTAHRARALQSIGAVVEREVVMFVRDRKAKENVEGTAVIDERELGRMDDPQDVVDLIQQRKPRVE